jgi:acyl-CoA thioester hydrolase
MSVKSQGEAMPKFCYDLEIYTFHIDFAGHVNNTIYLQWMEVGRIKLLEAIGWPIHQMLQTGVAPVVTRTEINYRMPLYLGDRVSAQLWLSELKNASAVVCFGFYNGHGQLSADGQQKGTFVDQATKRPRRLLPEERSLFVPYLVA